MIINKRTTAEDINSLKIGDLVTFRKNGTSHEFLGFCPIDGFATFVNIHTYEIVYKEF